MLEAPARLGSARDGTDRRWLLIEGPSGVGKCSLVQAGMIPAMRRGWIESRGGAEPRNWAVALMQPGHKPLLNLAQSLSQALPRGSGFTALRRDLEAAPEALRDWCPERVPPGQRFLLVADQLEEVFTLTRRAGLAWDEAGLPAPHRGAPGARDRCLSRRRRHRGGLARFSRPRKCRL